MVSWCLSFDRGLPSDLGLVGLGGLPFGHRVGVMPVRRGDVGSLAWVGWHRHSFFHGCWNVLVWWWRIRFRCDPGLTGRFFDRVCQPFFGLASSGFLGRPFQSLHPGGIGCGADAS